VSGERQRDRGIEGQRYRLRDRETEMRRRDDERRERGRRRPWKEEGMEREGGATEFGEGLHLTMSGFLM
jgi:hypothetical protein